MKPPYYPSPIYLDQNEQPLPPNPNGGPPAGAVYVVVGNVRTRVGGPAQIFVNGQWVTAP